MTNYNHDCIYIDADEDSAKCGNKNHPKYIWSCLDCPDYRNGWEENNDRHDKTEAKQYGDAIGWENIDDWYYNLDGIATLILKIPVAELFTEELNGKELRNHIMSCEWINPETMM